MNKALARLLRPKSIAVIGGGFWCRNVITQCQKAGYPGAIWAVHPNKTEINGLTCYKNLADLPAAPDASFIGVNRFATIETVTGLAAMQAGGAVCFASGFLEAKQEDAAAANLQDQLLQAAGDMPILGPNCYGFINYLDNALLWPDQHGGQQVQNGVAIVTQSSNIAINLTMQTRGLPLAYIATAGNQAQQGLADIGAALLADPRVTALGLHIEGFSDLRAFEALAATARNLNKPIVALKVGKSQQARTATVSHTASLAGEDAGAQALLERLGIARVRSLPDLLETLKLLHVVGPLKSNKIASISCSGGEASLMADTALGYNVNFPALSENQQRDLRKALGPMVALANPLDYHTYIWTDGPAMADAFVAMMQDEIALTLLIVDFPRSDRCRLDDWECAIKAALDAQSRSKRPVAMVTGLQENLPEEVSTRLIAGGVVPLMGMNEALAAAEAAAWLGQARTVTPPLLLPGPAVKAKIRSELVAKTMLADYGIAVPISKTASSPKRAAKKAMEIGLPVVLKGLGIAHKTEAGAVKINLTTTADLRRAAKKMPTKSFLVEEMVTGTVAELLLGVVKDPAHGFVLTIAAGGILTELLEDRQSLLIPSDKTQVAAALDRLKIAKLLNGYRGAPAANMTAIVDTIMALQKFVVENSHRLEEAEINPLLCGTDKAIAADALIKIAKEKP